jgi:hypothetical protein
MMALDPESACAVAAPIEMTWSKSRQTTPLRSASPTPRGSRAYSMLSRSTKSEQAGCTRGSETHPALDDPLSRAIHKCPHPNPLPEGEGESGLGAFRNVKPITNRCTGTRAQEKSNAGENAHAGSSALCPARAECTRVYQHPPKLTIGTGNGGRHNGGGTGRQGTGGAQTTGAGAQTTGAGAHITMLGPQYTTGGAQGPQYVHAKALPTSSPNTAATTNAEMMILPFFFIAHPHFSLHSTKQYNDIIPQQRRKDSAPLKSEHSRSRGHIGLSLSPPRLNAGRAVFRC